jgi:hypothetical protein
LLLGLAAVLVALIMAGGQGVLAHAGLNAHAAMAKEIITIPLAASMRL